MALKSGSEGMDGERQQVARIEAEKRLTQVITFNQTQINAINTRPNTDSEVKRRATREAQGQLDRAQAAQGQLKNPNLSVNEINQIKIQGSVSEDTLKQQRNRRSSAATSTQLKEGNAQIRESQRTELKRLGGDGVLVSGNTGPTKTSQTLGTSSRVTARQAEGKAPLNQPWESQFVYTPPQPATPNTPKNNWDAVADPNSSGFGRAKEQVLVEPLAQGESVKNRLSPILIPVAERSLINQYSPSGKPVPGPQQVPQRYSVGDRTFKDLATAKKFAARTSENVITPIGIPDLINQFNKYKVGEKLFPTKEAAQEYIDNPPMKLSGTSKIQYNISQTLDTAAQYKTGNTLADAAYSTIVGHPLGSIRSVVEGVNVLDNLGKFTIPGLIGTTPNEGSPIPIKRTGDEVLLPIAISEGGVRQKSFGEIKSDIIEYSKKYSVNDLMGGALSTYVPIGMGIKAGATIVGKFTAKKLTPKLISVATSEVRKVPAVINPRKPIISKESLYSNIQTTQKQVSGTPKLLKPYIQPKNPSLSTGVIPKESIKGTIKTSPGFIPNKPTRPYTPLDTKKPVSPDPNYTPARRANEIDYTDAVAFGFKKTKVPLGVGVTKPTPNIFKPKNKIDVGDKITYHGTSIENAESILKSGMDKSKSFFHTRDFKYAEAIAKGDPERLGAIGRQQKYGRDYKPTNLDFKPADGGVVLKVTSNKLGIKKIEGLGKSWDGTRKTFDSTKISLTNRLNPATRIKPKETYFADKQFRGFQSRATVIGKINLSKGFVPSKIKPVETKKLDFANPWRIKPRKFDEPKVGKGDKLTGKDGSIQIVKSKYEVVKLKKQPTPVKLISRKENVSDEVLKAGSMRPIVILTKPMGRIARKKKPIEARTTQTSQVYAPQEYQRVNIPQKSGNILSVKTSTAQSVKIIPRQMTKLTPSLAIKLTPRLATKTPQALKQIQPQKFKTPTPNPVRPKLKAASSFKTKVTTKTILRESPNPRPKTRIIPAVIIPLNKKLAKKKEKKSEEFGFLGNTKTDNIEGLFRRSTIIHGDKRITKQVRKDKKAKFKERGVSFFSKR